MVDSILRLARESQYDFRIAASPEDPLRHLFPEWVSTYRLKWAIARCLCPARILEIGVRFGYSAHAFLDGSPSSKYLGIDIDSDESGGCKGAIHWAHRITRGRQAEFLIADSQTMDSFPGGTYDLIHVDGRQEGEGQVEDLLKALRQSIYVLVDGFYWTRGNFLKLSEFLYQFRDLVEYSVVIPSPAGDLLIRSAELDRRPGNSHHLHTCSAVDALGSEHDLRLSALAHIAGVAPLGRALDLGCGRGSLSIALARDGYQVTGVDRSEEALAAARQALRSVEETEANAEFLCGDIRRLDLDGQYHLVVMADVAEELLPEELQRVYQQIAAHLHPDGVLVVRSFPNRWFVDHEHRRRVRQAAELGAYLPQNPRTGRERLLRVNEQTPQGLRKQLRRHFGHVLLWFARHDGEAPVENLRRRFTIAEMRASGDLYAVASHQSLAAGSIVAACSSEPLSKMEAKRLELQVVAVPEVIELKPFLLQVRLSNRGSQTLRSCPPHPVYLTYHWLDERGGRTVVQDGTRSFLEPQLRAGTTQTYPVRVSPPPCAGRFTLRVTVVQEWVRWYDGPGMKLYADFAVLVK